MTILNQLANYFDPAIVAMVALNFVLLIALIIKNWSYILNPFKKINNRVWILLLLIFIAGLLIRIYLPVHTHKLYIDEHWYMEAGKNILQTGYQDYYPKSIGWPFILSISFGIFGTSNLVAIDTSIFFGAISILIIFFLTYVIAKKENAALLASLLFSLFPLHIIWSASAETNATSLFFVLLSIFFYFLYYENDDDSLLWLSVTSTAFISQIRPENYIFFPLFILGCLIYKKNLLKNSESLICCSIIIFLTIPNFFHILDFQISTNWIESDTNGAASGDNWSFFNLFDNSIMYGKVFFNSHFYPSILSFLSFVGFFYLLKTKRKACFFLATWFIFIWITYFSSWFQTLGGKERFYTSFDPIVIILSSIGIFYTLNFISSKNLFLNKITKSVAIFIILLFFIPYYSYIKNYASSSELVLETQLIETVEKEIPKNCTIISSCPTILKSTTDMDVIDIKTFFQNENLQEKLLNKDCILFIEDYCCRGWDPKSLGNCNKIKSSFTLEDFKSYTQGKEKYTFYKILKK